MGAYYTSSASQRQAIFGFDQGIGHQGSPRDPLSPVLWPDTESRSQGHPHSKYRSNVKFVDLQGVVMSFWHQKHRMFETLCIGRDRKDLASEKL